MANLTLIQGEQERTFVEHPIEVARRALLAAAEVERSEMWSLMFRQVADSLPDRPRKVVA